MKSSPKKQKPYVSGDYDKIKNELPENLRKFCDIINKDFISKDNPDIGDLYFHGYSVEENTLDEASA